MGNFLTYLKSHTTQQNTENISSNHLINISLAKLREYHGSFKSVCDIFSIDLTEFEQIFGKSEDTFQIWDTDNNGLIDALELFSGLILFAEAKFEEKIRFLFDLFDFNELNSLSLVDLEFTFISCCNATYKIYSLNAEVNEEEISKFLNNYFTDESRINISQMLKWCTKVEEIKEFFNIIKREYPVVKSHSGINAGAKTIYEKFGKNKKIDIELKGFEPKPIGYIINSKKYQSKLDWVGNLSKKVFLPQEKKTNVAKDISVKINWVYGYRCHDVRRSIEYIPPIEAKSATEKLIYFTACIVIIYYPKLNEQKHYVEHDREVISIAVAKNSTLVASGELGDNPAIHIWDSNTLQNLGIVAGVHQNGVHLMAFFEDDQYLATCGIRQNTPILIYSVKNFNLLLSTYVNGLAIDLFVINNYIGQYNLSSSKKYKKSAKNLENMFIICTYTDIICFTYKDDHFITNETNINEHRVTSKIKCGTALRLNIKNPSLMAHAEEQDKTTLIITGHKNGQVLIWEQFALRSELANYKNEILNIGNSQLGVVIATDAATLHFWNLSFKETGAHNIKNIDLTTFPFKLFNFYVCDLVDANEKLIVTTTEGDVVELHLSHKNETTSSNIIGNKQIGQRINYITKLTGNMKALSILEKDNDDRMLFVAGESSIVYGFSLETHEIIDIWNVGENITSMDSINFEDGGTVWAVGCANGKIFLRVDWEEHPKTYECGKQVNDIKFSSDTLYMIAVSEDSNIYVFVLNNNSYFQLPPKKVHLENEIPISITFTDENKSVLIGTSTRNQYKIDLPELKVKNLIQENEMINCTIWNIRYPVHPKTYQTSIIPLIIGGEIKVFLGANEHGYVFFWKDREQLESNCGGFLKGHSSTISRLVMTKNQDFFYSLGLNDNTMIEWKVDYVSDYFDTQKNANEEKNIIIQQNADHTNISDECLIRELDYCYFVLGISDRFRDQFILFRGTNQKTLNSSLNEAIEQFDDNNYFMKRPPSLSVHLDYVYGFQSFDKRKTLYYVHFYPFQTNKTNKKIKEENKRESNQSLNNKRLKYSSQNQQKSNILIPDFMKKEMLLSKQALLPYDETHVNCERHFLYFSSRLAIIYNPLSKTQRIYQGHRYKITCISVHPSRRIVASGESSARPSIHVWNVINLEPYKILRTYHKNGIVNLAFSRDGALIVSLGMDKNFSIQVTNWRTEEIIAIRNTGQNPIFDLTINPYNKYEFVTVGYQNISIWEISGRNLLRKSIVNIRDTDNMGNQCVITCVAYISFNLGNTIQSDIICGNNFGSLGLIVHGKYITVKEDAHTKLINVIKITEIYEEKIIIITASEDEFIKIWDTKFNLVNQISMRKLGHIDDVDKKINVAPQSIDIFTCKNPKHDSNSPPNPILLFGTRNGCILEAAFSFEYSGVKVQSTETNDKAKKPESQTMLNQDDSNDDLDEDNSENEDNASYLNVFQKKKNFTDKINSFKFNYNLYLRSHCSQILNSQNQKNYTNKKIHIALHPFFPILVSTGEDNALYIWDTDKNQILNCKEYKNKPTAIKFSPDGNLLVIGFINGTLLILDSKIDKSIHGKISEKYVLPNFDTQMIKDKEDKTPILSLEFSKEAKMLAISYDNARSSVDVFDTKLEREGSYIGLFVNKSSVEATSFMSKDQSLYTRYTDIRISSLNESHQTESSVYSNAVYFMTFSEDEHYLLIYYQLIDNNQIRVNNDPKGGNYTVWDIKTNSAVKTPEVIKEIRWSKLNFPNSLNCLYQFYQNLSPNEEENMKDNSISNIKPIMSCMLDIYPILICGSMNGDLHFVKSSCLYSEPDFLLLENLPKEKMCLAKSYPSHISFVDQIEIYKAKDKNKKDLFTTGLSDETILKWRLEEESPYWDVDNIEHDIDQIDVFSEMIPFDKFQNLMKELLPLREEIFDIQNNVEESTQPEYEIYLENIIGRKASNSRNNLFYDYDDRVIYIAGCNFVITSFGQESSKKQRKEDKDEEEDDDDEHLRQEFIKVEGDNLFSGSPEISAIALSHDRKILCAGTLQQNAKLLIWDICSRTKIKSLSLINAYYISYIKFAYDSQHICCTAVTKEYKQCVYLIDTFHNQILGCANFLNSVPFKIKDLEFFPNSIYKFVTCGIKHMSVWNYIGSTLSYYSLEIENPKDLIELKKDPKEMNQAKNDSEDEKDYNNDKLEEEGLKVTFLCVVFVNESIVTGGDEGFLYLWDHKKIVKKQNAHPKAAILCLYSSKSSPMFVSGGIDGRIILWEITNNESNKMNFEKFYEYNISHEELSRTIEDPKNHIQSLCIGSKYILAGTKSGDIYEIEIPDECEQKQVTKYTQDMVQLRMNCHDHDIPKAIAFSPNNDKLFSITKNGILSVWDLKTLNRESTKYFAKETLNMIVCRSSLRIIIAFEKEIVVLRNEEGFPAEPNFKLEYKTSISDMKLSYHEKFLAVALKVFNEGNAKIEIYGTEDENKFKTLCTVDNLSTSIEFLDFSTDNFYLLYKDSFEEVVIIDLSNLKKINTVFVEFDIEWCSDGIKASDKAKGIQPFYSDGNRYLKITKIGEKSIIVSDEMGTLRIFNYPCEGSSIGYMRCYTDHMNYITNCALSYDRKYLVTSSDMDRCMMVWRVIKTEPSKEDDDEDEEEKEPEKEDKNDKFIESP